MNPLLSLSDAAARLGLTKASLRTEIRKGRLTPIVVRGEALRDRHLNVMAAC